MYYIVHINMNKTGRKFVDLITTKFIPGFYWREENNQSLFLDSTGGKKATKFIPGFYRREENNQVYSWILLVERKQPSLFLDSTGGKKTTRFTVQLHTINSKGF
jgi:hypothetical protein